MPLIHIRNYARGRDLAALVRKILRLAGSALNDSKEDCHPERSEGSLVRAELTARQRRLRRPPPEALLRARCSRFLRSGGLLRRGPCWRSADGLRASLCALWRRSTEYEPMHLDPTCRS